MALAAGLLAGCFRPDPMRGLPCEDGWCPPPEVCNSQNICSGTDTTPDAPPTVTNNIAFVTSDARPPNTIKSLGDADAWCAEKARGAELAGTYVAWMSSSTVNARDRLAAASGWVRPDGKPFVATVSDLLAGRIYYPPRLDENGTDRRGALVATGSDRDGMLLDNCDNFSNANGSIAIGYADGAAESWSGLSSFSCTNAMRIYCFGTDRAAPLEVVRTQGKLAFVTSQEYNLDSAAGGDTACDTEAGAAAGKYHALLATTTASARASLPPTGPWVRKDGIVVTMDLTGFDAPLDLGFDGQHYLERVAVGASTLDQPAASANNCADWADNSASFKVGASDRSNFPETLRDVLLTHSCGAAYHLYCFER